MNKRNWREIHVWKRFFSPTEDGKYEMRKVNSLPEKARVLREFQHTRKLPSGDYSLYGFKVCNPGTDHYSASKLSDPEHKVVHPFSIDVFFECDDGELVRTYDAAERAQFLSALLDNKPLHARLSPWFFSVDWDGIDAEAAREVTVKPRVRGPRI